MVLHSKLPIGAFEFLLAGILGDSEDIIVISLVVQRLTRLLPKCRGVHFYSFVSLLSFFGFLSTTAGGIATLTKEGRKRRALNL